MKRAHPPLMNARRMAPFTRLNRFCCICILLGCGVAKYGSAQTDANPKETTEQTMERLMGATAQLQAQMEANQKQMAELQRQLAALRQQIAAEKAGTPSTATASSAVPGQSSTQSTQDVSSSASVPASPTAPPTLEEIRERQAIDESQIATHEQTKVETQSKYQLTVSGLVLFNGFVNTRQVDVASAPAYALAGSGSTGLSIRQTVLGFDARGPHIFGARSYADLRVDFFDSSSKYIYGSSGLLRLRTAHAGLKWDTTEAFFAYDRTLLQPNAPSSLVAVGQPELAWAGNLWSWNPQAGIEHRIAFTDSTHMKLQAALIDAADPQLPGTASNPLSLAERSRWPGSEARISLLHGEEQSGAELGVGGYFSPHRTAEGTTFNAWAGTIDLRLPFAKYFELTSSAYRGQGLGGLGGGGYNDYIDEYDGAKEIARPLDDVGGWAQLKAKATRQVELNFGYGIDNPFAREIHASMMQPGTSYVGLARNRAFFGNVIYSPKTYLLLSLEYRRLWSHYATGPVNFSDVIGIGAGYRF
jgi:hypothetical protein